MDSRETESGRRSREAREIGREKKESKEVEDNAELKVAAAMERADYLVHEVKTSKNQVQNIVLHMQAVLQAIRDLRTALQLPSSSTDETSTQHDKKRVEDLQRRIAAYRDELLKMKDELILEQVRLLRQEFPLALEEKLHEEAQKKVDTILAEVEK